MSTPAQFQLRISADCKEAVTFSFINPRTLGGLNSALKELAIYSYFETNGSLPSHAHSRMSFTRVLHSFIHSSIDFATVC